MQSGAIKSGVPRELIKPNHLTEVNGLLLARTTFAAAVKHWPGAKKSPCATLRIIEKTWPADD